ncbi:translation elongation factor EF1B gamma [Monosporozyma unispora]|nr:translation elongation factor EF1B gamma [Kazachstania unispora]
MSLGTVYANFRIRSIVPRVLVNYLKLDVNLVDPTTCEAQFAKDFPLKKVPDFISPKGYKLTEVMAIAFYLINLSKDTKAQEKLLGANLQEKAQIIRWQSLANSDLLPNIATVFQPLKGDKPYFKKVVDDASANVDHFVNIFEERLKDHTYLATENISLADIVSATAFTRGFNYLFGTQWRKEHPAIVRWFKTMMDSEIMKDEYKDFQFIDEPLKYTPPKKEKKEKKEQQPKKKEVKKEEKPADPAPEKKPKHPLEALGRSTFVLDEWKRKYSNEDTRPVALPWFWEHYNPEEYSLWKVEYKYNDELTLTFMSNNLIGGFFNRLTGSTKYMFGAMVVYGENNNNGIVGVCMVRGQDAVPAFNVAPDWESYSYTKLDPTKEEEKEFVNNMWAWDKPVVVNGENQEIVDGKVLK